MENSQQTLFTQAPKYGRESFITTTNHSQQMIMQNALNLYNNGKPADLDVTYNRGNMWNGIPGPRVKMDRDGQYNITLQGDFTKLPIKTKSIKCAVYDPPFLVDCRNARMANQYGCYDNTEHLEWVIYQALQEFSRVLKTYGILIFKIQDFVNGRQQYWSHLFVHRKAAELGFGVKDVFIFINENFIVPFKTVKQNFAKKTHCYFIVFTKSRRKNAPTP